MKIAIIAHVFYANIWPELAKCIKNVDVQYDLYVTYSCDDVRSLVKKDFSDAIFVKCDNRGYDVWPFLNVISNINASKYKYIVKLHTKRDAPNKLGRGDRYRTDLLSFIDTKEHWLSTVHCLEKSDVGMVGGTHSIFRKHELKTAVNEFNKALRMAKGLGIHPCRPKFVAGTMFIAKPEVFAPLMGRFCEEDFETTPTHMGGQLAHMLERILGFCACSNGMRITNSDDSLNRYYFNYDIHRTKDFLMSLPIRGFHFLKRTIFLV